MKLVCHIGTPKTASTFLQNTCAGNSEWLRANGVIYPDLMSRSSNHLTLFYAASEQIHDFARDYGLKNREDMLRFREKIGKTIADQVAQAPKNAHTFLISSENLTGNLRGATNIQNLGEILKPHFDDIKIVIYLRRQDDAILSMYGEHLRMGYSGSSFPEFVNTCLGKPSPTPYLYYRRMLSDWINVFGRDALDVRIFDKDSLIRSDILFDFMTTVFGPDLPDLSQVQPAADDNTGLSAPALEFLHQMYPYIPRRENGVLNKRRVRLSSRINALPSSPRPRMTHEDSQMIMTRFKPANTWLKNTFFADCNGPVFADLSSDEGDGNIGQISIEQFAEYAGILIR